MADLQPNIPLDPNQQYCGINAGVDVYGRNTLKAGFIEFDTVKGKTLPATGRWMPLDVAQRLLKAGDPHPDLPKAVGELEAATQAVRKNPSLLFTYPKDSFGDIVFGKKTIPEACSNLRRPKGPQP